MSLALLSVVGAIGRAGLRKEVGLLRPGPRGPKVLRHQMVWMMCRGHGVPEMVTPAMRTTAVLLGFLNLTDVPGARSTRDGDTGNEDNSSFARFFKLDRYAMFSFAMTSGLASDSDKFKIIITLRRAQNLEIREYKKISFFHEDNSSFARFFKLDRCAGGTEYPRW